MIQPGGDGTVVQQDPPPAAQAALGSTVSISVSRHLGNVPDVSGMTIDVAKTAMLLRYGYQAGNVSYVPDGDEGKVVRTLSRREHLPAYRLRVGRAGLVGGASPGGALREGVSAQDPRGGLPGLRTTGYGVIEVGASRARLVEAGVIEPNPRAPIERRLADLHAAMVEIVRGLQPRLHGG